MTGENVNFAWVSIGMVVVEIVVIDVVVVVSVILTTPGPVVVLL